MTPAEHYTQAEEWLHEAAMTDRDSPQEQQYCLAKAQIHATLATVDAQYLRLAQDGVRP